MIKRTSKSLFSQHAERARGVGTRNSVCLFVCLFTKCDALFTRGILKWGKVDERRISYHLSCIIYSVFANFPTHILLIVARIKIWGASINYHKLIARKKSIHKSLKTSPSQIMSSEFIIPYRNYF